MLWSTICKVVVVVGFLPSQSSIHKCQACCKKRGHVARKVEAPVVSDSVFALSNATRVNLCTTEPSEARSRSEPLQSAVKTLTHRLPQRGGERKSVECDEEERTVWRGSIFSFILCIQQNKQRSELCCNTDSLLSITVKFQIKGFTLPTFMVISKPACPPASFQALQQKSDRLDFYRLHKRQATPPPQKKKN